MIPMTVDIERIGLSLPVLPERLFRLQLPPADSERLGLPSNILTLRRCWPRSSGHLLLEYRAAGERIIGGQWFRDKEQLAGVARATARATPSPPAALATLPAAGVLLQAGGADCSLPGLAPLVARHHAALLAHCPERRAVVRLTAPEGVCYAKAVRPARAVSVAAANQAVRRLAGDAFHTAALLEMNAETGVLLWSALPGRSLNDLLGTPDLVSAARSAGEALRALHEGPPPAEATPHRPADEIALLQQWLRRLEAFGLDEGSPFHTVARWVFRELAAESDPPVLLHRDFYDKQILIDGEGRVSLLDFDTLAVGEAALDLANILAHLELRAMQGRCTVEEAMAAAAALLEGYPTEAPVRHRLGAYAAATRLRLACVYAFRPSGSVLTPMLLSGPATSMA